MSLKSVTFTPTSCLRCGGAAGAEAQAGDVVKLFLDQTRISDFPEYITGIISAVGQVSLANTTRIYTFQYESDDLEDAATSLTECDILSAVCSSCCELMQDQFNDWFAASAPIVTASYDWTSLPDGVVRLYATARTLKPGGSTLSYQWYPGAVGGIAFFDGDTAIFDVPLSGDPLYPGGVYRVVVTDAEGLSTTALVHVTLDDRLSALDINSRRNNTANFADQVDRMLTGSTDRLLFTSLDNSTPSYPINIARWTNDLDLTPVAVWNSDKVQQGFGTAITPYHILLSWNVAVADGATIRFVANDGTIIERTLVDTVQIGSTNISVGVLSVALPDKVGKAMIPPYDLADWATIAPGTPVVVVDVERKANLFEVDTVSDASINLRLPADAPRNGFDEAYAIGDIGAPVFAFFSGRPVLLGCITASNVCYNISSYKQELLDAFAELALCPPNVGGDELPDYAAFPWSANWRDVLDRPHIHWGTNFIAVGREALRTAAVIPGNLTTGRIGCTAFGNQALKSFTDGGYNTAVGDRALEALIVGPNNTAYGEYALGRLLDGQRNAAVGSNALYDLTTGERNTAIGDLAGMGLTDGDRNTFVGDRSRPLNATDSNSACFGENCEGFGPDTQAYGNDDTSYHRFRGMLGVNKTPTHTFDVAGTFNSDGDATVSSASASTSISSGALVVSGGVGIGGALWIGSTGNFVGAVTIQSNTATSSATTGALIVTGGIATSNNIWANGTARFGGIVTCTSSTASTSTTTGALVVTGGAGFGGSIFVGGSVVHSGLVVRSGTVPTVASAATIAPTTPVAFVSGTTTIDTITPPSQFAGNNGQITLIPTGLWSTSTAGNIALITAAVVNKALTLTYDSGTSKWYPSY